MNLAEHMEQRNQKLIKTLMKRVERDCPDAVDMIGICGSFCNGDFHERSDLDLMILINDPKAYKIAECFVIGEVGFDFYCTNWENLEKDAECGTAHMAKLMDTKIVYSRTPEVLNRYMELRVKAKAILDAPFSSDVLNRAEAEYVNAENAFSRLMRAPDDLFICRVAAVEILYYVENAVCILNKTYYKLGVKRIFEEFSRMERVPEDFKKLIIELTKAKDAKSIKEKATALMRATDTVFEKVKAIVAEPKEKPSKENIGGTLEEMISNFRGKMWKAIESGDTHASISALGSLQSFFDDLASGLDMPRYDALSDFDPDDLEKSANAYEKAIEEYSVEYKKAGMELNYFDSVDQFAEHYLK